MSWSAWVYADGYGGVAFRGDDELRGKRLFWDDTGDAFELWLEAMSHEDFAALIQSKVGDPAKWLLSSRLAEEQRKRFDERFREGR